MRNSLRVLSVLVILCTILLLFQGCAVTTDMKKSQDSTVQLSRLGWYGGSAPTFKITDSYWSNTYEHLSDPQHYYLVVETEFVNNGNKPIQLQDKKTMIYTIKDDAGTTYTPVGGIGERNQGNMSLKYSGHPVINPNSAYIITLIFDVSKGNYNLNAAVINADSGLIDGALNLNKIDNFAIPLHPRN